MDLKRFTIPVIGLLLLVAIWYVRSLAPKPAMPTAGRQIIFFGDSLVSGRGASPGRDLVSQLTDRIGTTIINAGRSGDTTESAVARLDRDVLSRDPRVVIVLLGGNDYLRKVPRDRMFANLRKIVEGIRAKGAGVVLVGINPAVLADPFDSGFEEIARRTQSVFVPDVLDGILGNSDLMSDPIHPNDRGYAMMAARIEDAVKTLMN
jgi:lysophospholipase L1-like esterase